MHTEIYRDKDKAVIGYVLNIPLSTENQKRVVSLQESLCSRFSDAVWTIPPESLHVTLMDWLAPLVEYGSDKDVIFKKIFKDYDAYLQGILDAVISFEIKFENVCVSPSAIFVTGKDTGEFEYIRTVFTKNIPLLPGTKNPPQIIHFTLARFMKNIPINEVTEFVSQQRISISEHVTNFRLVREERIPLLRYLVIKNYSLKN